MSWLGDRLPSGTMRMVGDEMTRTLNRLRGLLTVTGRRDAQPSADVDGR